jgi:hypothetical protein
VLPGYLFLHDLALTGGQLAVLQLSCCCSHDATG